ncbi:MAG: site-2 protease family protein, partial [Tepidisphaeraceae bacterium]
MTVSATTTTTFPCPRCGNMLVYGQLACTRCGALVYSDELTRLAAEAQREESGGNVIRAALLWRQALTLLPPDSSQHHEVSQRVGMLTSHFAQNAMTRGAGGDGKLERGPAGPAEAGPAARVVRPNDPWRVAVAKTAGSMLLSIIVYAWMFSGRQGWSFGIQFATGFVLLILVHELGHSLAMRYFGLSASPPIFIPFLGAVINLRQMPRNALEEAIVGIGGPVTGTLAAGVTYLIYLQTGSGLLLRLAEFGFLLNLFNMLPVPPLDGG